MHQMRFLTEGICSAPYKMQLNCCIWAMYDVLYPCSAGGSFVPCYFSFHRFPVQCVQLAEDTRKMLWSISGLFSIGIGGIGRTKNSFRVGSFRTMAPHINHLTLCQNSTEPSHRSRRPNLVPAGTWGVRVPRLRWDESVSFWYLSAGPGERRPRGCKVYGLVRPCACDVEWGRVDQSCFPSDRGHGLISK